MLGSSHKNGVIPAQAGIHHLYVTSAHLFQNMALVLSTGDGSPPARG